MKLQFPSLGSASILWLLFFIFIFASRVITRLKYPRSRVVFSSSTTFLLWTYQILSCVWPPGDCSSLHTDSCSDLWESIRLHVKIAFESNRERLYFLLTPASSASDTVCLSIRALPCQPGVFWTINPVKLGDSELTNSCSKNPAEWWVVT